MKTYVDVPTTIVSVPARVARSIPVEIESDVAVPGTVHHHRYSVRPPRDAS